MSNAVNGNGARAKAPAWAEPRYVLMDLSGEHYRLWSGLVRAEYWGEIEEEEFICFPSQEAAEAVVGWLRDHDMSYWQAVPHPRDRALLAPAADRAAARPPRRHKAGIAGRR